jgi:hypothetical protein
MAARLGLLEEPMTMVTQELAISAVPFDAVLVAELLERLTPRLGSTPVWLGHSLSAEATAQHAATSRLALVLHQRLWRHDAMTQSDEAALQQRLHRRPASVRVVTLDSTPVPEWLASVPRCAFSAIGLDGVSEFAVEGITASGGAARRAPAIPAVASPVTRMGEEARPFLVQPRAFSSLRREFDALAEELRQRVHTEKDLSADTGAKLDSLPHRLVVQLDGVAISFSWVSGRIDTVADGRLLVIEWDGVVALRRGIGAGRTATPVRECIYRAEASGPDAWRWRLDGDSHGRAFSTSNLVGEWFVGASLAANAECRAAASA